MKQDSGRLQLNTGEIEQYLKMAVGMLTPDVLDRIDLSAVQDAVPAELPISHDTRATLV